MKWAKTSLTYSTASCDLKFTTADSVDVQVHSESENFIKRKYSYVNGVSLVFAADENYW